MTSLGESPDSPRRLHRIGVTNRQRDQQEHERREQRVVQRGDQDYLNSVQSLDAVDAREHADADEQQAAEETTECAEQHRQETRCAHQPTFEHAGRVARERVRERVHSERRLEEQVETETGDKARGRARIGTEVVTDCDCRDETEIGRDARDPQMWKHRHLHDHEQDEQHEETNRAHAQPPGRVVAVEVTVDDDVEVDAPNEPGATVVVVVEVVVVVGAGRVTHCTPGFTTVGPPASHNNTDT